jgi:hypothetical protein
VSGQQKFWRNIHFFKLSHNHNRVRQWQSSVNCLWPVVHYIVDMCHRANQLCMVLSPIYLRHTEPSTAAASASTTAPTWTTTTHSITTSSAAAAAAAAAAAFSNLPLYCPAAGSWNCYRARRRMV